MLRTPAARHLRRRSGAVLIVVLAMLVLFAVLGLSFVLYSEAQLSAANGAKVAENKETPPNAVEASEYWVGSFIYPTTDEANPLRAHSLTDSKYPFDQAGVTATPFTPFAGSPNYSIIPTNVAGQTNAAWNLANVMDRDVVNFTRVVTNPTGTEWFVFDPMRGDGAAPPPAHAARTHLAPAYVRPFTNRAAPFTYPDRTNFYLAQMNPSTGEIVLPSFHRPDLFGSLDPTNANWTNAPGRLRTLRPRPLEHPNFPPVPMDADGVYRADVSNMKFVTGSQKNDSLWMYNGGPVLRWRNKNYVACVAPLVLDLSSRVNLSVAGNMKGTGNTHVSKEGWGAWEVNPIYTGISAADLQLLIQRRYGKTGVDFTPSVDPYTAQLYTTRINGGRMPWQGGLFDADGGGPAANDGPLTLPLAPPAPNGFQTTPIYNNPLVVAPGPYRYEPTQADLLNTAVAPATGALAGHPAQFNPLVYGRGPTTTPARAGGFGHDDLLRLLTRYSDPKGRPGQPAFGTPGMTPGSLNAAQARALSTTFSTTQQWASVPVATATGFVRLGPVDLNRPLPDYRKNPTLPPSPVNLWSPTVPAEYQYWYAAHSVRQRLARDIFVRIAARYGLINGPTPPAPQTPTAVYDPATGNVQVLVPNPPAADPTGNRDVLMRVAQFAVNLVDFVDGDDVSTPFVWRPVNMAVADPQNDPANFTAADAATRVVYGTEMPRLVLNEVYASVENSRNDRSNGVGLGLLNGPMRRQYWVELHNPTPPEPSLPTVSAARADLGAARLRYEPGVTNVQDPVTGLAALYPAVAPDYNPYRLDIAVVRTPAAPATPPTEPYSAALLAAGYGAAAADPVALLAATADVRVRIDNFTPVAAPPPTLVGDARWLVLPATAATGPVGGNQGYFVLGPEDQFPTPGVANSLSIPDAPAALPVAPVNALEFTASAGPPGNNTDITAEVSKASVVVLRRLVNPYLPPNDPTTTAGPFAFNAALPVNPYVTVDYVENVPTRDRVGLIAGGPPPRRDPRARSNAPSVGRIHPFAAYPTYGTATAPQVAAVQDQAPVPPPPPPPAPPHTFFSINTPADNARPPAPGTPTYGFEWLAHLDRELVSLPEAAVASRTSPALLTHAFFNSTATVPSQYHGHAVGLNSPLAVRIHSTDPILTNTNDTIRMLTDAEGLLACGSRLPGVPLGGREPGKVNVNTMNDPRLLTAVFDPQAGNGFTTSNPTYVSDRWTTYLQPAAPPVAPAIARTANGVPRATVHEGGTDYPLMWGSTQFFTAPTPPRDHPFGRPADTTVPNGLIFPNYAAPPATPAPGLGYNHPYLSGEPLQKAWNSLTPTSDSFLLLMTVGFFEVENVGPWTVTNQPVIGRELFKSVPGDLRAQFGGVIDRSQLATQIATADATGVGLNVNPVAVAADPVTSGAPRGVQTKLVADVQPTTVGPFEVHVEAIPPGGVRPDGVSVAAGTCAVLGDGVVYVVTAGSRIRVGYGDSSLVAPATPGDGEWLTVSAVAQRMLPDPSLTPTAVPGQVTLTLTASVAYPHAAGSPVGNVQFGNPGPQPGVRLTDLQRRGLVPYFTRIEP